MTQEARYRQAILWAINRAFSAPGVRWHASIDNSHCVCWFQDGRLRIRNWFTYMEVKMKDHAWVWLDLDHEFKAGEERWAVECPDCPHLALAGPWSTRDQAVRMANTHNTVRHTGG